MSNITKLSSLKHVNFNWKLWVYILVCLIPLFIVNQVSDLPVWIGNGEAKAREILTLQIPSDNFYPVGKALMLLPFVWLTPNFFLVVVLYLASSAAIYYFICRLITNKKIRLVALLGLPANPYLVWLCYSSQDTVFELFLLLLLAYSALANKHLIFITAGFLLCLTRPSYWVIFFGLAFFLLIKEKRNKQKSWKKYLIVFLLLPINMFFNLYAYGSSSLAGESGITAYFSYNKYLYLALPKLDMDVFLSTKGHVEDYGAHSSAEYTQMAIKSIKENPKEVLLATMQKFDSYIFDVQKVPHLPGEYYLSKDATSIIIGNQRLTWPLVLGNLLYEAYRSLLLIGLLLSAGVLFAHRKLRIKAFNPHNALWLLTLPWLLGLIPGLAFYTETRFKIVSELLLVPFICLVLGSVSKDIEVGKEHAPR